MKIFALGITAAVASLLVLVGMAMNLASAAAPPERERLEAQLKQGNFKDAYGGYRTLALEPNDDPMRVGDDLAKGIQCLVQLGRVGEVDEFRNAVVQSHKTNWRLLQAAAESYLNDADHGGEIVAGVFQRGRHQGDGRQVSASERDRAQALQLLVGGLDRLKNEADHPAVGRYFLTLADALLADRSGGEAWRLQSLTSLSDLPEYDEQVFPIWGVQASGAPVQPDGTPVYHHVPASFAAAKSDGERWRWALGQASQADPGAKNAARMELANFLHEQFGTQSLGGMSPWGRDDENRPHPAGILSLETLNDEETVARLASGVRRFVLPDEFNPIKIYQSVAEEPKAAEAPQALGQLASIFEGRRQYERAATYLKQSKDRFGDQDGEKSRRLEQIMGAWGRFEPTSTQAAGRGATVDYRFRNGRRVRFEAHEIDVPKLLSDVKEYLTSSPPQLNWQQIDLNDVGTRLVAFNQRQYQGRLAARWELELEPRAGHLDRQVPVTTPLQKAGAYLLTARMERGNTSHVVVWLDDTVIVRKNFGDHAYYFVADSRSGRPVPGADMELFGWRMAQEPGRNVARVEWKTLRRRADRQGQLVIPQADLVDRQGNYQWLCIARSPEGRRAHLGFSPLWFPGRHDLAYDQVRVYAVTDRPVYRPGQPVRFKLWMARARYDQPDAADFAGSDLDVEIRNPKNEKVFAQRSRADSYGGVAGSFEVPSGAPLGVYQILVPGRRAGSFRVEEYKKPEFEVNVEAPSKPVMLGEKVPATIKAKYYFGSPVAEARVKYKITRTTADDRWYPSGAWDWLFGPGYWWFAPDRPWYPGWGTWGTARPAPWWWQAPSAPPEVVAEAEVPILPDGTFPVQIDTALAKELHPDQDQRYEITAEVTDQSRRTIVGTGSVLVARRPFRVHTWVDRGHYRVGDAIEAGVRAQTLDRKPVAGKGTLRLLGVSYDAEGKAIETPLASWDLALDADGQARQVLKASAPGQYRLSATIDDGQGHTIEGGYLLVVQGPGFDGSTFRFNDLEIVPDRKEYHPGETLRLLINTNQPGSTVLLFVRPVNGIYLPPKLVFLQGKSTIEEIGIVPRDMPNIFVEALTISGGKVHSEAREIAVPPESRMVNVAIEPAATSYRPGQKATLKLKLTAPDGKPFLGSTVLTVYDKSIEYISGGSNVPEIREVFWKWKRNHYPQTDASLARWFSNQVGPGEVAMSDLGEIAEIQEGFMAETSRLGERTAMMPRGGARMMGGMGGMGGDGRVMFAPAAAAPARGAFAQAKSDVSKSLQREERILTSAKSKLPGAEPVVQPVVRTNFADTAFWAAALETKPDGTAEVEFPLPESLTTWKVRAWTLGKGTKVGQADAEVITTKDLLVRLQAPRFFVEKDEVVLSANVHNKLKSNKSVQVILESEGSVLQLLDSPSRTVDIAAGGEHRVDWRVKVAHEGQAVIRMKALTDEESDAAQMTFPAHVHGMLKMEAVAGSIRSDQEKAELTLRVPAERKPEQSRLEIRYSPTLAGALVEALPYLADYPYGCTEQTLNRFLPTVITQRLLIDLGVDLKVIKEQHTNLNAQQLGHARERAKDWKGYEHNPVFDRDEVAKMSAAGIQRLADMQLSNGGWGWFSGFGEHASPHTTALVVHGLQLARGNDVALPQGMLERGVAWLTNEQGRQVQLLQNGVSEVKPYKKVADDSDALVFMVLADAGVRNDAMLGFLDRDRTHLSVYAKSLFGLALHKLGEKDRLAMVLQNLSQYVVEDNETQTAYLKLPNEGYWWWWYGSEIETDACYLKLLAQTDPKRSLAPRLVKYVLNNRSHGAYWKSTRDTAFCIEAMASYLKASGEDRPDMTVTIAVDGQTRKEVRITPADLFKFDSTLVMSGKEVEPGSRTVTVTKQGRGPLYFNAYLTNFTLEDPITRAGLEIKIDRKVYRLVRNEKSQEVAGSRGQAATQQVERFRREPLADGATLKSGELVEVELEIDSKNDYEYLIFEDFKAAGFEPVDVRSGYNGNDLNAYVEFRDDRVAFFSRSLARGKHSVGYRLRAEIPGTFHALPARAQAMYAPELRANSDEIQLKVVD
jgi:uncharacterized protein YfaS (alpha-2-macroglobulin family)